MSDILEPFISDKQFYNYNKNNLIYNPIYLYIISRDYEKDIQKCLFKALQVVSIQYRLRSALKKSAVIIDLDETFLFNDYYLLHTVEAYRYNQKIYEHYKNKLDKRFGPVLPFMIILYEFLVKKNITVFFLTARDIKFKKDTIDNLKLFNVNAYNIIFKEGEEPSTEYKSRNVKEIENAGFEILMCLNDQEEFIHKNNVKMPSLYKSL